MAAAHESWRIDTRACRHLVALSPCHHVLSHQTWRAYVKLNTASRHGVAANDL